MGLITMFLGGPNATNEDVAHVESYPVDPERPTPLTASNVADYAGTYEERLFYNDLLASQNHRLEADERVIANCTSISVSNASMDGFHVQLECQGGVTDSWQPSESEEFIYSATYRLTNDTTRQTELRKYPFGTDRAFNNERNETAETEL